MNAERNSSTALLPTYYSSIMSTNFANLAKPGFLCPGLSFKTSVFIFCAFAFVQFSFATPFPADPPVSFVYNPGTFNTGDTISIDCMYGDATDPVSPTLSIHLVHPYSGFTINPNCPVTIDVSGSWFCQDDNCETSIWVDHQAKEIHFLIERTDENPVEGHGYLASGGDICVTIDNLGKKAKPNKQIQVSIFPNPANEWLIIQSNLEFINENVELINSAGQVVSSFKIQGSIQKVFVGNLESGIYFVRLKNKTIKCIIQH